MVDSENNRTTKLRTEKDGITCCGEDRAERSHQPTALVHITEVGGNDAENKRAITTVYG